MSISSGPVPAEVKVICDSCNEKMRHQLVPQAFMAYVCRCCGEKHVHATHATPNYCHECSAKQGICSYCGQQIFE